MLILLNDKAFEAALIKMAAALAVMRAISLDVRVAHPGKIAGQILVGARDDREVKMVPHDAICQQIHVRVLLAFDQQRDKGGEIAVLVKDALAAIAAIEHVINQSADSGACGSGHGGL